MEDKQDREYREQRMGEGKNWVEKMYLPRGRLESQLNQDAGEGNELAYANWN